jgi:nickel transport protein
MKKCLLFILALTLLSALALYAHDTWVAKEGGVFVVMNGHHGKSDPYKPEYVKGAKAYDVSGKEIAVEVKPEQARVLLVPAQEPALLAIIYAPGAWVKTPTGWKNKSKREVKDVIESGEWVKSVKQINQWGDRFSKPLGGKMEIVPLKNPLTLKVGDKLAFQAVYDGKPLAGATVKAAGVKKGEMKTDANGLAEVAIKKNGLNLVVVTRKTATPNNPDADVLYETAHIAFEVK